MRKSTKNSRSLSTPETLENGDTMSSCIPLLPEAAQHGLGRRRGLRPLARSGAREVARDMNGGRDERRGQDQPDRPEQRAPGDRDDEHGERVDAERGPHRNGLDELL